MEMANKMDNNSRNNFPELTRLIRSIQKIEGNPDCFETIDEDCDHLDCAWREYCLNESQKDRSGTEGGDLQK